MQDRSPHEAFCKNLVFEKLISPEFDNIEKDETPEIGRKTPISSKIFNVENDKLLGKSVVIGIIR
jgi:hypothetical protein